jgi:hypothetical protein
VNVPEGNFFFEGASEGTKRNAASAEGSRLPCFLYRHIRIVKLVKDRDHYNVMCSCAGCDAVFSPCTHMFLIFDYVAPDMLLAQLPWHPRNTKVHYSKALFEDETCPLADLIHTVVSSTTVPKIPSQFVDKWLQKNTDSPSSDGIPPSGRLDENFEQCDDCDGDVGDHAPPGGAGSARPRVVRRQAPPDKTAADNLHWQVTECLGKQHAVYKEYCAVIKNFRDDLQRRGIEHSGSGKRDRTRAFWESGTGQKIDKVAKVTADTDNPGEAPAAFPPTLSAPASATPHDRTKLESTGITGKRARAYLEDFGPSVNTILEIYPDKEARRAGQRWFMIVKKAKLVLVHEKISVEACRWCKTNTLQPCPNFKEPAHCHLENVKAYGVREAPIFKDVASEPTAAAAVPPVPSPAQILAKVQQMNAAVSGVANKKAAKKPQFCTCGGAENLSRTEKCCPYCEQFNLD